jgi:hypothetical protein
MCVASFKECSYAFRDSKSWTLFAVDIMLDEDTGMSRKGLWQTYNDSENLTA